MPRLLYTVLFYCLTPLILLKLWRRGSKAPLYRERWAERFGFSRPSARLQQQLQSGQRPVWFHAVSFGETVAIAPLIQRILDEQPDQPVVITSMTPTGSSRVQQLFGDRVEHCYCPYDMPDALARFHKRYKPRSCVIVETELWPNLIHSCAARNVPVLVANARLSERSARGYGRFGWLVKPMLQQISQIAVQNREDGQRFIDLGFDPQALQVTGSIKFDIAAPQGNDEEIEALRTAWGRERRVLIAASTHDNEEQQIIEVYRNLQSRYQDLLLILVPRHPERFSEIYDLSVRAGLKTCRRSLGQLPAEDCSVYLGDTMGEMMLLYGTADIAFVGGSLIERGGHNPMEPAVLSKPVVVGPYVHNFKQVVAELEQRLALRVVADAEELQSCVADLLEHPDQAAAMGVRGERCVAENRGALEQLLKLISKL